MRALVTLTLTVLIVLLAVLFSSMVFVAAGLATIYVYASTHSLEASLAAGLIAGVAGWMGIWTADENGARTISRWPSRSSWNLIKVTSCKPRAL